MEPYYEAEAVKLYLGDCIAVMAQMDPESIDAIVCDPPYGLEFMGKAFDTFGSPRAFQDWCKQWAREAFRVLKPGGHMAAFGGDRTYHRMASGVEDAGFEIRHTLAWIYGSGYPKSRDISKDIDKRAGAEREVVGTKITGNAKQAHSRTGEFADGEHGGTQIVDVTAPATEDAQRWQGWGTALKPAWESIVLARKPLSIPGVNVLQVVELELRNRGVEGEITWTNERVNDAERSSRRPSSSSTVAPPAEEISAGSVGASETASDVQPTRNHSETRDDDGVPQMSSEPEPMLANQTVDSAPKSSTPTAVAAPVAANGTATSSHSTISTEAAPPTGDPSTARYTAKSDAKDSRPSTESFAGIATGLTGSMAHVLIRRLPDGSFEWPDGLPLSLPGGSTVADNVLRYGTGALNIDGTRIGVPDDKRAAGSKSYQRAEPGGRDQAEYQLAPHDGKGRWPATVILDEEAAAALDAMTGKLHAPGSNGDGDTSLFGSGQSGSQHASYGTPGGASRYFYTAKAPRTEREAGLEDLPLLTPGQLTDRTDGAAGTKHPRAGAGREQKGGMGGRRNDHPT